MKAIRRYLNTVARHPALASVIIGVLPLIVAACTNGGSSGSGY